MTLPHDHVLALVAVNASDDKRIERKPPARFFLIDLNPRSFLCVPSSRPIHSLLMVYSYLNALFFLVLSDDVNVGVWCGVIGGWVGFLWFAWIQRSTQHIAFPPHPILADTNNIQLRRSE